MWTWIWKLVRVGAAFSGEAATLSIFHHTMCFREALASRVVIVGIAVALEATVPPYDTSNAHRAAGHWSAALANWDGLHFRAIAERGYRFENQLAFFPGVPWMLRASRCTLRCRRWRPSRRLMRANRALLVAIGAPSEVEMMAVTAI